MVRKNGDRLSRIVTYTVEPGGMRKPTYLFITVRTHFARVLRPVLESSTIVRSAGLYLLGIKQRRVQVCNGHTFHMSPRDFGATLEIECTGEYERTTSDVCRQILKPGMVFVDVGAHVGLYALPAARAVGETGTVYAFEPDPENFTLLERNVQENGYRNVCLERKAIADIVTTVPLHRSAYNSGDHQLFYSQHKRETVPVECTTLDTFFSDNPPPRIDLLKMDIQGAEAAAYDGMSSLIHMYPEMKLIIEFSPYLLQEAGRDPQEFLDRLEGDGFTLHVISNASKKVIPAAASRVLSLCRPHSFFDLFCERRRES